MWYTKQKLKIMSHTNPPSPWLAQLQQEREHFRMEGRKEADVVIVGAGIAGVSTAYSLLKYTKSHVLLLDAGRIAHGATGRNAGQLVSYFERPFTDIVRAFGLEMAVAGQTAVESAWGLLEDIIDSCELQTPLHACAGYAGFCNLDQILTHLQGLDIREKAGLTFEKLLIRTDPQLLDHIPKALQKYCMPVPHSVILNALETDDQDFIAAEVSRKGCMNSALFCEELVSWMITHHGDRFRVVEHMPVTTVTLNKHHADVQTEEMTICAKHVVLCTNGFENFTIENAVGEAIDPSFHETVQGRIGYMAGYFDEPNQVPVAVSYYSDNLNAPYHYLTRRPYDIGDGKQQSLICIGGPERILPDRATYDPLLPFPGDIEEQLDREVRHAYSDLPHITHRRFLWQGLMGYTPNGIRRIGFEPRNNTLLYNLGCNGVGILPSIYGGKRIAELLAGMHLRPSIFDPELGDR